MNPIDIKIKKPTVKLIIFKKASFRFMIEFDTMITYIKVSKLYKLNPYPTPMKRPKKISI